MLDQLRAKILTLKSEAEHLDGGKRSPTEVETELQATVARWSEVATKDAKLTGIRLGDGQRLEPLEPHRTEGLGPLFVALLGEDAVLDGLLRSFLPHVPKRPDAKQRTARLAAIEAELDKLEREEERICESTGALRRADARPEIVLDVLE